MAAKGVTFITNILLIILLVQQHSTNSFYSLFLQHLNFSPSHLGFVRASQIWTSALLVSVWMLLTKEHLIAQGRRIVITICVIALIGLYVSLVFFPHSMSCVLRNVTHCHSIPSSNGISKGTQRLAAVHFNNISTLNQSSKAELLPTETTILKYSSSFLTNLKDLPGETLSNYSQESSSYSEPNESNTTIIPKAGTVIIDSLNEFNNKSSKNLSSGISKETLLKHEWPLFSFEEKQDMPQTPVRTFTVPPANYHPSETKQVLHNNNIISEKLKQKMTGTNTEHLLQHHYFINNHHHTPTVHKIGRKKQKTYINEVPVNDINQYYSETARGNSYSQEKNGNEHYFDKFKPILDLVSHRHKELSSDNVPSSHDKSQRLTESSNDYLNDQMSYSAALSKPNRFINTPYATSSKKKQENEISGTGVGEKHSNTVPEFISSFNTKHNSFKPLEAILPDNRYKVHFAGQVSDEDEEDLRKMTSLEKTSHVMQKREKLGNHLTKQKTLRSTYPYWKKQCNNHPVHSLIQEPEIKHKSKRHSKSIKSEKQVHKTPKAHDLKTLHRHSTHKWQNKRVRTSKSKADIEIKYYTLRNLKSVEDFNDSYISRTEIDNGTKIMKFLNFSSNDSYTFLFAFFLLILAEIFSKGITSVCKKMCTENAAVDPHVFNFGLQQCSMKTWGIVICPLLMAIVIKVTCVYQPRVFFMLAAVLLIINTPLIIFMLPISHKTSKEMPLKLKKFKTSIGSNILVLVSGFGTACNFEFIFWHIDLQQNFAFNYQLLFCSYLSLRAIAQTSVQPSVEQWQEEHIINERKTRALWSIASHAALCLHSLGASYLHPTWTLILLGLLMGCSDSFQNSEAASAWWTIGYGCGCLLGGCMVDSYGTELLYQGVAIVMFTSCILECACYVEALLATLLPRGLTALHQQIPIPCSEHPPGMAIACLRFLQSILMLNIFNVCRVNDRRIAFQNYLYFLKERGQNMQLHSEAIFLSLK